MKIQIDGTNTLNKGAELMLVAIYQQIIKKIPAAEILYIPNEIEVGLPIFLQNKNVKRRRAVEKGRIPSAILRRLRLPYAYFTSKYASTNIDLVLDGAGFQFSDQWGYTKERLDILERYYKNLKNQGTKIVLLPQAFGPFETKQGKRMVKIINDYVDIIIAREKISYKFIADAGANKEKLWLYPDFTLLVKGTFPERYESIRNKVCVIPNKKMITHTKNAAKHYGDFIKEIIVHLENSGEEVFLLNHEGAGDLEICKQINESHGNTLTVVNNLTATEVKGVIGASRMVVSSRFHGVASALNQGVPCLSTSWNHKYQMLFEDFGQHNTVLAVDAEWNEELKKIDDIRTNLNAVKSVLVERKMVLTIEAETMWNRIWQEVEI
ncbi:polysaccharide pyruvyl transferase family protein [Zobellia nedashkovskayae]